MRKPLVSVIVPTYRRELFFIERAINSILNQTYRNVEVIVIDDNSSESIYRKRNEEYFKKLKDKNIIYIKNEKNLGGALARNVGIKYSHGEYITFLDDDDEYLPCKIEHQVEFMIKYKFDMSFSNLIIKNENGRIVDYRKYNIKDFSMLNLLKYHLMHHITGTPTYMYKKKVLEELEGFPDVKVGQEFILMLNTIKLGYKIGYLNADDVISYSHKGERISTGKNKIEGEDYLFQMKKQYFSMLNFFERSYIKFRHNIVKAVYYYRKRKYFFSIYYVFISFIYSPYSFFKEPIMHYKKIKQGERNE